MDSKPEQFLTSEKKNVIVDAFVMEYWSRKFLQSI